MDINCKYVRRYGESCRLNNNCTYPDCQTEKNNFNKMEDFLIKMGAEKCLYEDDPKEYYLDLKFSDGFSIVYEPDNDICYLWTSDEITFDSEDQVKRWAKFLKKELKTENDE